MEQGDLYDWEFDEAYDDTWLDTGPSGSQGQQEAGNKTVQMKVNNSSNLSSIFRWGFVIITVIAVIGGGTFIFWMEAGRRVRLARLDFQNEKQRALLAFESGDLTSAAAQFMALITHPGCTEDEDYIRIMAESLTRIADPQCVEKEVKELSDAQLLQLHDHGVFSPVAPIPPALKGEPEQAWISALRLASRDEVPRRHSKKTLLLADIPRKLAGELAELHHSESQTLEQTNRLEVEEKTAQRWLNQFHERLSSLIPFGLDCADWRDRFSFHDAKVSATEVLKRDPSVHNPDLLIAKCSAISIVRRLDNISMNMSEVPKVVSVTTRFQAKFTIKISEFVDLTLNNQKLSSSQEYIETIDYVWQSDRWVLKNPGGYQLLANMLPDEIR